MQFEDEQGVSFCFRVRELSFDKGGLGCRLFPSALIMCEWMLKMNSTTLFRDKDVLELGSGVGACGLLAARIGSRRVILSDFYISLLKNLMMSAEQVRNICPAEIQVKSLDWNDDYLRWTALLEQQVGYEKLRAILVQKDQVEEDSFERQHHSSQASMSPDANKGEPLDTIAPDGLAAAETFDVIIATDVLYERVQADLLAAVLALRLRASGVSLMVLPVRDVSILHRILRLLCCAGLTASICGVELGFAHRDWWRARGGAGHVCHSAEDGVEQTLDFAARLSSSCRSGAAGVFLRVARPAADGARPAPTG